MKKRRPLSGAPKVFRRPHGIVVVTRSWRCWELHAAFWKREKRSIEIGGKSYTAYGSSGDMIGTAPKLREAIRGGLRFIK
jgi:hypothetical protein